MRNNALLLFGAMVVASFSLNACSCDNPTVEGDDGGFDGSLVQTDGGPGSECLPAGHPCAPGSGGVCCSGTCDPNASACTEPAFCKGPAEACTANTECCTNNCANGTCSNIGCMGTGDSCAANTDCCTGTCGTDGTCQPLAGGTCKVTGEACGAGAECCSTNCQGGVCVRAYSCQANGDICYRDTDCCGVACSSNDGTTAGRCLEISGGGGGGCTQSGNPCDGPSNCCTRVCVDPGSGVTVCQQAGGCVMTGQYCSSNQTCCGGGTNPNGSVTCGTTDRCDNGQSCNPVGNICGAPQPLPDGGTFSVNASQNCCDGLKEVCKADSSGIPRCFGGGSTTCPTGYTGVEPCCIAAGNECQFKDQCCNGAPCVPDTNGVLRCSTSTCVGLGSACDPANNACCAGTVCTQVEVGAVCTLPQPKPDGGTLPDGGAGTPPDAGTDPCNANGETCSVSGDCCSGICSGGVCVPPGQCQPQDAVCTSNADCCTGLGCSIPSGQTSGTCQPSSCQGAGQTCSPSTNCCTGLACLTNTGGTCDGTSACKCNVIIN